MKYIIVDLTNCFFRARHVVRGDLDLKLGMSLHITLSSIKKAWQDFNADHVVICLEGRSWRKDFYDRYKRNRTEAREAMAGEQKDEEMAYWAALDSLKEFLIDKTNCTVLYHSALEADDLIAGWTQTHTDDDHVIISTDGDFAQLIAPNVHQYNGVTNTLITHEGYFDEKGKRVLDKKTKEPKPAPQPSWMLFEKCMRGDATDNVFSAYPGVRTKGTKNKVGLQEAFADRDSKGFNWNNLMLQRWTDHDGVEHRVIDDYTRNVTLCDLSAQPAEVREYITSTIDAVEPKEVAQVGVKLMKFAATWSLERINASIEQYAEALNAKYNKG